MSQSMVLFVHVASATLLVGGTAASRVAQGGVCGAADLATLRGALDVVRRTTRFNPALALVVLGSGAYLGQWGTWTEPWFWVATATWFANLALAVRVVVPAHRSLGAAAAQAGDGPVPAPVDALRRARRPAAALDAMVGLDLGTLALMVIQPEAEAALWWPALGVAALCAIRAAGRTGRAEPAQAGR